MFQFFRFFFVCLPILYWGGCDMWRDVLRQLLISRM